MTQLIDAFGRTARDLRIAVTDRCNLRCTYCMPDAPAPWGPHTDVLSYEEITRLARIFVERFGVDGIRLTGGEPTLRADLPALVARLATLRVSTDTASSRAGRRPDLAITTNGTQLRRTASALRTAGLDRANVSLDTLRQDRFAQITHRDGLADVLDGIEAAVDAGLAPLKINAVIERGVNDDEIIDLARFGRQRGLEVRFIEFMPLDGAGRWSRNRVVGQDEIVEAIDRTFPLVKIPARGAAPADRWRYADGAGVVAVIPSVTQPFCADCDRVRITADGQLRTCLFATTETDLRTPLRNNASDDDLAARIEAAVAAKWRGHAIDTVTFLRPHRSMSQIGG